MSVLDDAKKLQHWFDRVRGDRANVDYTRQEIADHEFGSRDFVTKREPGEDRMRFIYDTTALMSQQLLAGGLHGLMSNPAGIWFDLEPEDRRLLQDIDVRTWLELARNLILSTLNSSASGWTTNVAEAYLDIPGFGMAALWVDDRSRVGLRVTCRPLREVYVQANEDNAIDVVFRELEMTARQFAGRFPSPADGQLVEVQRALEKDDPEKLFPVFQLVTRSDDPYAGSSRFRKPWASRIWTTAEGKPKMVERSGYDEMPMLTPRWAVEAGEVYGRGPGWNALPDARMLNQMQKTILKAAQKAADPPLLVSDEGVLPVLRTHPGGVNYVQDRPGIGGQPDAIRPLQNNARVDIGVDLIDRKIQGVRNAFYSHILQMFEDPRMTATQVLTLATQAQRMMAPVTGRIAQELHEPLIDRCFGILIRRRALPAVPSILQGQTIRPVYTSAISRAQRAGEAQAVVQSWQGAALIVQASQNPDALDLLDPVESVRIIAEASSLPARAMRTDREIAAIQEARARMQEQAKAMETLGAGADIAKTLTDAVAQAQAA